MVMPYGIVASSIQSSDPAVVLLESMLAYWDASSYSGTGNLNNLGTVGSALDMVPGTTTAAPLFCPNLGRNYLQVPPATSRNYISAASSSAFTPSSSLDLRCVVTLSDYTPGFVNQIMGRFTTASSNRSWMLLLNTTGDLILALSDNGSSSSGPTSTVGLNTVVSDGNIIAIRALWTSAGTVDFYTKETTPATSKNDCDSNLGWTQLGNQITASVPTSIYDPTTTLLFCLGNSNGNSNSIDGKWHYGTVIIDGVPAVSCDPALITGGSTSWVSDEGITLSINRATSGYKLALIERPTMIFDGVDDSLIAPDNDALHFIDTQDFTVGIVVRVWNTLENSAYLLSKASSAGWGIRNNVVSQSGQFILFGSGGGQPASNSPPESLGELRVLVGVRNTSTDEITSWSNGVAGTAVTDDTTGNIFDTSGVAVSALASGAPRQACEFFAAFIINRTLTDDEITLLNNYFQSVT